MCSNFFNEHKQDSITTVSFLGEQNDFCNKVICLLFLFSRHKCCFCHLPSQNGMDGEKKDREHEKHWIFFCLFWVDFFMVFCKSQTRARAHDIRMHSFFTQMCINRLWNEVIKKWMCALLSFFFAHSFSIYKLVCMCKCTRASLRNKQLLDTRFHRNSVTPLKKIDAKSVSAAEKPEKNIKLHHSKWDERHKHLMMLM